MALTDLDPTGNAQSAASSFSSASWNPINMITSGRGYLDTLANKYILKPANAKGLTGFVFDYEGVTDIVVQSEITDHYSEQNTFINDHAAQKPIRITLRGFVGELAQNPNACVLGAIATLQNKLTSLEAITGKYTPSVVQKIQKMATSATTLVNKVDDAINRTQNLVGLFLGSSTAPTKQELAYQQLYALWSNNIVFTLDTPFNYFRSVMIEHMMFSQPEETKQWAELSVTVKEVRFLKGNVGPGMSAKYAAQTQLGRSKFQSQAQANKGKTSGILGTFSKVTNFFKSQNANP